MFKECFKYYKSKKPPPDLKDVFNFHEKHNIDFSKCKQIKLSGRNQSIYGLIPPENWEIFEILSNPGLIYIKNPFTKLGERYWTIRCLRDYTTKPNKLNIDPHNVLSEEENWWDLAQNDLEIMRKLRWATLGYHHDWDTKVYSEDSKNPFPTDLNRLCSYICNKLNFDNFNAEAAIINYYHLDSTLSGHTDHSEQNLEAPLLSYSFGSSAIFLLGGKTVDVKPTAILIKSGDIVIMSKESRLCYHGVPKILLPNVRSWDSDSLMELGEGLDEGLVSICKDERLWGPYGAYLDSSRINMNVRQVLLRGQKRLINS